MKFHLLFIIVLLVILTPIAALDDGASLYTSSGLTINTVLSEELQLIAEQDSSALEFVKVNISFFPRSLPSQEVLDASYYPTPQQIEPTIIIGWDKPSFAPLSFKLTYKLATINKVYPVTHTIPFPLRNIPSEVVPYTYPEPIIDSDDPSVQQLASQLAEGETDLLVVLDKLAVWTVQHVQYNLSTVTAKASKSASWVLQNRQGVCDELTSLFMAMARSLGIPARFVSGISYTNSPASKDKWGPHGWAEVYIPSVGWVPYDITYEEFGFVDPTHIIAKYSKDAAETSLEYEWRGKDVQLKIGDLSITADAVDFGSPREPSISLALTPWKQKVGFGSYNALLATVENKQNYYQSIVLTLAPTAKILQQSPAKQFVLLKPHETKTVQWIVKTAAKLEDNFVYTFPFSVTAYGVNATTEYTALHDQSVYSLQDVQTTITTQEAQNQSTPFRLDVRCAPQKQEYALRETPIVTCTVQNSGTKQLQGTACVLDDCKKIDIPLQQEQQFRYTLTAARAGKQQYLLVLDGESFHKIVPFFFLVQDAAKVGIADVVSPVAVEYDEDYALLFRLNKDSETVPENLTIMIGLDGLEQNFFIPFLDTDREFTVQLNGEDLDLGRNNISIETKYTDKLGTQGKIEEQVSVVLKKPTFWQRMVIYFRRIGKWMIRALKR